MRKEVVLITGANGEIGHGLIEFLGQQSQYNIVALDVAPLDAVLSRVISSIICCWAGW
jgi:threonine 3-dehydrogenase